MSNNHYQVSNISFKKVLVPISVEVNEFFKKTDFALLACTYKDFCKVVPEIHCLVQRDWSPLLEPCIGYQDQTEIDPHIVDMATSFLSMAGLDPGKVGCILKGEYIVFWQETNSISPGKISHQSSQLWSDALNLDARLLIWF